MVGCNLLKSLVTEEWMLVKTLWEAVRKWKGHCHASHTMHHEDQKTMLLCVSPLYIFPHRLMSDYPDNWISRASKPTHAGILRIAPLDFESHVILGLVHDLKLRMVASQDSPRSVEPGITSRELRFDMDTNPAQTKAVPNRSLVPCWVSGLHWVHNYAWYLETADNEPLSVFV